MKILKNILKYTLYTLVGLWLVFIIGGLIVKSNGQYPIDETSVRADQARIVQDKNGRNIEYFTYGSNAADAPVMINIHGSGLDGTFEKAVHHKSCEALGIRGIAISLPGCGNTDMKIGRKVVDWPKEDLAAVLEAEGIDEFMITGHSQGNPHAMAAAFYYKDRVVGLGMNAPLMPIDVSAEIGLKGALASDDLLTTEQMDNWWNAYWFFGIYLYTDLLAPKAPTETLVKMGPNVGDDTEMVEMINHTFARSMVRGAAGETWESALDVCYLWGFDPREIQTQNIVVWHAADDTACPPEIGAWLAEYFKSQGAKVDFRNDNIGYNHMTFCSAEFRKPENSMAKVLLDGLRP